MSRLLLSKLKYSQAIERRLLAAYYRASASDLQDGITWYENANAICARISDSYGITLKQACGVMAALSPGRSWEFNVQDAETFISAYQSGARGRHLPIVGTYGRKNVAKSIAILQGKEPLDVLGGDKVRSFYSNILDPSNESPVTIDRHAKCAAYGIKSADNSIVRNSEYEYLAEHYRRAAFRVELLPCQFQACVWVTWRRLNGNLDQLDLLEGDRTYEALEQVPF